MPSFASCSILRIAQFQTPVSWKSHVLSCPSWDTLRRSFSCLWIILYSFLVLDILFDDFQRRTAHGGDKVCVRPQRGQSRLEPGIFLSQGPRRTTLDLAYQAMNAILRIDFHQEIHGSGMTSNLSSPARDSVQRFCIISLRQASAPYLKPEGCVAVSLKGGCKPEPIVDCKHYFRGELCIPTVPAHYPRCLRRPQLVI